MAGRRRYNNNKPTNSFRAPTAPTMTPPKSRIEELQEALRSPWLPFDMSQPNKVGNVINLARDIYVAYKLIPTYEDFVKQHESELEQILKRRPTAVPRIKILITNDKDNSKLSSNESDSSCEKLLPKCDVVENMIISNATRRKFIFRSVKRILNNSKKTYKGLSAHLKKVYRKSKIEHCVVSLVKIGEDKYLKLQEDNYLKLSPSVESHKSVPETENTEDTNEEMDTSISHIPTSEITQPELVIDTTIDAPSNTKSVTDDLTKTDSPEINIETNEEHSLQKLTDITNNLDKLETNDENSREIIKTSELNSKEIELTTEDEIQPVEIIKNSVPKLFISTEVEFTKKSIQEKPSLNENIDIKPNLTEINITKAKDVEVKTSLPEINIMKTPSLKNVDITKVNDVAVKTSLTEINIIKPPSLKNIDITSKTASNNLDNNPCDIDLDIKPNLSEINITKAKDVEVKTSLTEINITKTKDVEVINSLPEINIMKNSSLKNVDITKIKDVDVKTSLTEIKIIKTKDVEVKTALPEINITKTKDVEVKSVLPEINITKAKDVEFKTSLPEINIMKNPPLKNLDITKPKDVDVKTSLTEINIIKTLPLKSVDITKTKDVEVKTSLPEINIIKTKDVEVRTSSPEINITKIKDVEVKTALTEINITKSSPLINAEISLTKSQRPDNTFPSLPGINISRKPMPEIDLRRKSETLDSVVTKTVVSKEVNIIRKSPETRLPEINIVKSEPKVDLHKTSISKEVNITINPSPVNDGKKIEQKASITRVLKDVDIERKSTDSVPKTQNKTDNRTNRRSKSSSEERKSNTSDSERSSPNLSKLESISETHILKSVSHKRNNSSDVKEERSKSKSTNSDKSRKSSPELTSNESKKSKSSEEKKSSSSDKSKINTKEPTSEELNIERKSSNPLPKSKNHKDKRENRNSSSEERKSNSPDISETHTSQTGSLKRKSKDEISSDVNLPLSIKSSKKRKSYETTNSKQNEDKKSNSETSNKISTETEKTRKSQERDSSKKSESNYHKSEKVSTHRRHSTHHGSKHESHKDRRKSTDERRKHRNSKDNETEPEKKKPRIDSKSTETVLDTPEENRVTVRSVTPQKNETIDATVPQDTSQNIKRRRQSSLKEPADLKLLEFTSYSCSKCTTNFSSHNEWLNHQNECKS